MSENNLAEDSGIPTKGRKIQIKQGLKANLTNETLDVGEFGLTLDTGELFLGMPDGTNKKIQLT